MVVEAKALPHCKVHILSYLKLENLPKNTTYTIREWIFPLHSFHIHFPKTKRETLCRRLSQKEDFELNYLTV